MALGQMLASNMMNDLVDHMLTPESVAKMVIRGSAKPSESIPTRASASAGAASPSRESPDNVAHIQRYYERLDISKVDFSRASEPKPQLVLVRHRQRRFGWKLHRCA